MTVKELKEFLNKCDDNSIVYMLDAEKDFFNNPIDLTKCFEVFSSEKNEKDVYIGF